MKVAVCMITYNHEAYIEQAIQSVLNQQCDFDFELVIGDDASVDQTRSICESYALKHPDKIRLLGPCQNLGVQKNFTRVYKACGASDYVAMLEGDDYWLDPKKLQEQFDFMQQHVDFSICFHSVKIINQIDSDVATITNKNQKDILGIYDLGKGNFIYTSSCFFRNKMKGSLPDWFENTLVGDYVLHMLNAGHGRIKFIDKVMSIYRIHQDGTFSTYPNWNLDKRMKRSEQMVKDFDYLIQHYSSNLQLVKILTGRKMKDLNALRILSIESHDIKSIRKHSMKLISLMFQYPLFNINLFLSCILSIVLPTYYQIKNRPD